MSNRGLIERLGCLARSGDDPPPGPRGRAARALAGLAFLGVAALVAARLGGPAAVIGVAIAAWLGLSHMVAALTRYQGCPELGAVASLLRGRRVPTRCEAWRRLDRLIG